MTKVTSDVFHFTSEEEEEGGGGGDPTINDVEWTASGTSISGNIPWLDGFDRYWIELQTVESDFDTMSNPVYSSSPIYEDPEDHAGSVVPGINGLTPLTEFWVRAVAISPDESSPMGDPWPGDG